MRPLLLLDVDGPLNPWAAGECPDGYAEHRFRMVRWSRKKLKVWLNPKHGAMLLGIARRTGAELVWATTWEHKANTLIGPVLGLPKLPVIEFAGPHSDTFSTWKYPAVARYAYGRPLAWLDDDVDFYATARDAFIAKREANGTATLLVAVDPRVGVTEAEFARVEDWLSNWPISDA